MSRKPANIAAAEAGKSLPGRRGVWAAVRELGTFTRLELRQRVPHVQGGTAEEYLTALVRARYVQAGAMVGGQSRGNGKVRQYSLVHDVGVDAPRLRKNGTPLPETAQQQMWLAMKIVGVFTVDSLASYVSVGASTACQTISVNTAASYVRHLLAAGYLSQVGGACPAAYKLVDDTGGHAPMVQRTKVVFDPNTNSIRWHEDIEP